MSSRNTCGANKTQILYVSRLRLKSIARPEKEIIDRAKEIETQTTLRQNASAEFEDYSNVLPQVIPGWKVLGLA